MWKALTCDNNVYMLKIEKITEYYEIYLTNLAKIWTCKLSKELIGQKFQECNPILEVKTEESLNLALRLLKEIDSADVLVDFSDSTVKLTINSNLSDFTDSKFKIKYTLDFLKSENDLFTKSVTIPLIQTIILLEKQQNMMKNLLLNKDRELEEYQLEKGLISRNDLITDKFEPDILISSSNKLTLNIFEKVEGTISRKYGDVEETVTEVTVEAWNNVKKKRKIYDKESAAKEKNNKILYKGADHN